MKDFAKDMYEELREEELEKVTGGKGWLSWLNVVSDTIEVGLGAAYSK
ncbi:MAG: ComC/BlpC family leader-containing pheromone/bacteriocin [Streptococcaceae bacterium]|jgi:bacteriocin-like protein|nr:ComC/BlpC family leader-containing pheromone/bacteriocin [Streptococcaceae bacterium]